MIKDKELRELFRVESEEHIQGIEKGLIQLETNPDDKETLEVIFREAHSIKGAARMVGVKDVELITNRFEDILGSVRNGETKFDQSVVDIIFRGIDAVRKIVNEAVTGEPSGVDLSGVIELLKSGAEKETNAPHIEELTVSNEEGGYRIDRYRVDTVRVETKRLDRLMTYSEELTVLKTRMAHFLAEINHALEMLDDISSLVLRKEGGWLQGINEMTGGVLLTLKKLRDAAYENDAKLELVSAELEEGIRNIRLIPLNSLFNLFPRMVRDMEREYGKEIKFEITGGETMADKKVIEDMKDPVMHILRNAVDHGIESPDVREKMGKNRKGTIALRGFRTDNSIFIEIQDDGSGLDIEKIKHNSLKQKLYTADEVEKMTPEEIKSIIFASGFSTSSFVTEISGRGVGLDVVRTNVEQLKGTIEVLSKQGSGCTIKIKLPITLATVRAIIVTANEMLFAVPVEFIRYCRLISGKNFFSIEGSETVSIDGHSVSAARLSDILEINGSKSAKIDERLDCIIISVVDDQFCVIVDSILDEREIVLKPHNPLLKHVPNISGTTMLGSGELCMVLNPHDMRKVFRNRRGFMMTKKPESGEMAEELKKHVVLLVEDSITTLTQEKRILESAGYEVVTAVDGMDALSKLAFRRFDAVVSDVMMPNMDGLTLTEKIRRDTKCSEMPVILVTTLASDEDKKRGLEAGANAYIAKPAFEQKILLDTLKRLI
ncbi:MAG: hybrid sensor histidine kinase/response regulator [Candidatus Schekmanbacteria bacterium]|nr:hybrid sensor histidine kinase/response regulator [Candidatus Schekmanbacteria bacterium]